MIGEMGETLRGMHVKSLFFALQSQVTEKNWEDLWAKSESVRKLASGCAFLYATDPDDPDFALWDHGIIASVFILTHRQV